MRPSVRRIEESYQDRMDFHILNVDNYSTTPLANKYRVTGIPMIVLLDAQGEIFRTIIGYQTEAQLTAAVEDLLAAHNRAGS